MIEGYTSVAIERFGGLVTSWPEEMLDVSLAARAENVRFSQSGVASREGLTPIAQFGAAIEGLAELTQSGGTPLPVVFDANGALWTERPAGSGTFVAASATGLVTPPARSRMQAAEAYGRLYCAFSDGAQGTGTPATFDGANLDPATTPAPTAPVQAQDGTVAGAIAAGTRYVTVLFQTRSGSLTAPGPPASWSAAGGKEALVSNIPIGPANVVARVLAFTVAGGSSAGPYFYIRESQTVNGVVETASVIEDNTSTSASFNFDDAFLGASNDVSDQFRAITLPPQAGVFFSTLTQRMAWWGEPTQPSMVRFSAAQDAGTYYGDTGFLLIADGDGQRITAVFELRDQLFVAKQDSLYVITPNDGDPATWDVLLVSAQIGVSGMNAFDVANGFAVFLHHSGAYYFDGSQPQWISDELTSSSADRPGLWERVNWTQASSIWAIVDVASKEARFGIPLDQAATPSHILKLSFFDGWERSFRFSPFTGRYHYYPGRRWSVDTVGASQARLMVRPLASRALTNDRRVATRQLVLASSNPFGTLTFVDPNATTDCEVPIRSTLEFGAVSVAEQLRMQRQGTEMVGLVQLRARGSGRLYLEAAADGTLWRRVLDISLNELTAGDAQGLAALVGEAVRLRIVSSAGTWRVMAVYVLARPLWALRPSPTPQSGGAA